MSTVRDSLIAARDNLAAQLEAITRSPKPTYSDNGQSYSWKEYQEFLIERIRQLKIDIDNEQDGDDIVEEISQYYP
jgi:transposase InsO family protein